MYSLSTLINLCAVFAKPLALLSPTLLPFSPTCKAQHTIILFKEKISSANRDSQRMKFNNLEDVQTLANAVIIQASLKEAQNSTVNE